MELGGWGGGRLPEPVSVTCGSAPEASASIFSRLLWAHWLILGASESLVLSFHMFMPVSKFVLLIKVSYILTNDLTLTLT